MDTRTNQTVPEVECAEGVSVEPDRSDSGLRDGETLLYGLAILSGAFLLFQVQPMIAKIILPWFGGVAAVWTLCLVFFQTVLLLGYFYAYVLTTRARPKTQGMIHASLLGVSLLTLPILPGSFLKPTGPGAPAWHILLLLGATVGLPFALLSSTSPLLQAWYTRSRGHAAPYRFYALSNAGSMLALMSYPVIVEPRVTSTHQAEGWSAAYALVAVLCAVRALGSRRIEREETWLDLPERPDWKTQALWIALAACGSALLLSITNHISQNIASVPFVWVIPLSLYLFTFILCFDRSAWYHRGLFLRLLGVALGGMAYALGPSFEVLPMKVLIPIYCAGLWVCCMFAHGELARLKPHPAYLTSFYLMISLGGAAGAIGVALLAPHVFSGYYELQCALGFCAILVFVTQYRDPSGIVRRGRWEPRVLVTGALVTALLASLAMTVQEQRHGSRRAQRNFYGVLRVIDHGGAISGDSAGSGTARLYLSPRQTPYRRLLNGTIDHGLQFLSPGLRRQATTYYSTHSGIGIALGAIAERGRLRVGVIGLGAGTLAVYGRPGDTYRFYEINPLDVQIAREEFSFLRDSQARTDIVAGDARLSLERETPQEFDALVVDAFSSDSIPVHLLTKEAFALYFRHLRPDGLLAIHISNQYLDLNPVVASAAEALKKEAVIVNNSDDQPQGVYAASWALVGDPRHFYGRQKIEQSGAILSPRHGWRVWTDNYSSLFGILK